MTINSSTPGCTYTLTRAEPIVAGLKRHRVTAVFSLAGRANTYLLGALERDATSIGGGRDLRCWVRIHRGGEVICFWQDDKAIVQPGDMLLLMEPEPTSES